MFDKWKKVFRKRPSTNASVAGTTTHKTLDSKSHSHDTHGDNTHGALAASGYNNGADIAHPVKIFLEGGDLHTATLVARGPPEDKSGTFQWYRSHGRNFDMLKDVIGDTYRPTLDDVGSRISANWIPDHPQMVPSSFGEAGPISLDPKVSSRVSEYVDRGGGVFCIKIGLPPPPQPSGLSKQTEPEPDAAAKGEGEGEGDSGGSSGGDAYAKATENKTDKPAAAAATAAAASTPEKLRTSSSSG